MKARYTILVCVLIGSILMVASSSAAPDRERAGGKGDSHDGERDAATIYGRMDADGSGGVTLAEFLAHVERRRDGAFAGAGDPRRAGVFLRV